LSEAVTATTRATQRTNAAILEDIVDAIIEPKTNQIGTSNIVPAVLAKALSPTKEPEHAVQILNQDMFDFLHNYVGPKFNLLHFDLPYDVKLSGQSGQATHVSQYDGEGDKEKTFDDFLDAIAAAWSRIAASDCHVLFWFPMKHYEKIRLWLIARGLDVDPNCYIWNKSPIGIIRSATNLRNVYEPCFIASGNNRSFVKNSVNLISHIPDKAKSIHPSEKPQQVMQPLLSIFVDAHTRMLDLTCGSGSAIRAAEAVCPQIKSAIGLEADPEFFKIANEALLQARKLAALSRKVGS
jgi:hypothetical protein